MRILLAVAALAALVAAPARAQVVGEQRLAVRLVTWGPESVALADARAVVAETDAYIRANSFGRTWLSADVAGWLHALPARPASCDTQGIDAAVRRAEPGLAAYPRVAYLLPQIDCPWGGAYFPPGVWMLGRITVELLAHELGHNYGVTEEGPAWVCAGGSCEVESYADPFGVMGHGSGHFGAYEKYVFGWIDEGATLDFRWTDRTRPSRPRLAVAGRGRVVTLRFPAADAGSGVAAYDVSVDGRRRARLETVQELGRVLGGRDPELELRLAPGRRRIAVVAVDRAGNRSPAATRVVRIR